jgi:hypothetical protein
VEDQGGEREVVDEVVEGRGDRFVEPLEPGQQDSDEDHGEDRPDLAQQGHERHRTPR